LLGLTINWFIVKAFVVCLFYVVVYEPAVT